MSANIWESVRRLVTIALFDFSVEWDRCLDISVHFFTVCLFLCFCFMGHVACYVTYVGLFTNNRKSGERYSCIAITLLQRVDDLQCKCAWCWLYVLRHSRSSTDRQNFALGVFVPRWRDSKIQRNRRRHASYVAYRHTRYNLCWVGSYRAINEFL